MNINNIQNNFKRINDFFSQMTPKAKKVTEQASPLWQGIFDARINFPNLDKFMAFRRNGATYGVGDPEYSDLDILLSHCMKNALLLKDDGVKPDFLNMVVESPLGAPHLSAEHVLNFEASPNFLKNLRNAFRIYQSLKDEFGDKEIKVCEIGAGYGLLGAMLQQLFNVHSYTVIDLPQNLYLTSLYLTSLYPNKSFQFIQDDCKATNLQEFNFVLAGDTERLTSEFDLIINIDSFGEMNSETALEYVKWANKSLAPNGILHSDNRVRVREGLGASNFSDLGYLAGWKIIKMDGTRTQAELLNQPHHICFMKRDLNEKYAPRPFDLASILYTLGLANSIQNEISTNWDGVCESVIEGALKVFEAETVADNIAAIQQLKANHQQPSYINYLIFLIRFAQGESPKEIAELDAYLDAEMREPANAIARYVRILDFAATYSSEGRLESLIKEFNCTYPHLSGDLTKALMAPSSNLRALRAFSAETIRGRKLNVSPLSRMKRRLMQNYFY